MFIKSQHEKLINLDHVECIMKNPSGTAILAAFPNKRISVLAENCTTEEIDELLRFIEEKVISDIKCLKSFLERYRSEKSTSPHDVVQEEDVPELNPEPDDPKDPSRHPNRLYHDEKYLVGVNDPYPDNTGRYRTYAEMFLARDLERYRRLSRELNVSSLIVAILDNLDFLFTKGDLIVTPILDVLLKQYTDVVKAEEAGLDGYGRESVYKLKPEIKRMLAQSKKSSPN